jgi:hypothetical protein
VGVDLDEPRISNSLYVYLFRCSSDVIYVSGYRSVLKPSLQLTVHFDGPNVNVTMGFQILVASHTNEILTLQFDLYPESSLTVTSSLPVGFHPSWITPHPRDPSLIFSLLQQFDGKVLALKYDENGTGKVVAETSSGGESPPSLLATDTELFVAHVGRSWLLIDPRLTHKI